MEEKKKKTKKKKEETKQLLYLLLGLAVVALLVLLLGNKMFPKEDYFRMKDRKDSIRTTVIEEDGKRFDTVAWLQVQGTNIDYPIIHSTESDEYPATVDHYGWLSNVEPKFQKFMIIEGHNIFNLSDRPKISGDTFARFEELMAFTYYDFAKENKYIQLTMDGKDYLYKIFAVEFVPYNETFEYPHGYSYTDEKVSNYVKKMKEQSLYDYDVDVNDDDAILTLLTCTRFYGAEANYDFRVHGRLVRENEKIDNYRVTKSSNYRGVEDQLKGDEEDEM